VSEPLMRADDVTLGYGATPVVHRVSMDLTEGGVGLIGESGAGKTTLARAFLGLLRPMSGTILYGGRDLRSTPLRAFRRAVQPVFQAESLDPRMRVGACVAEALPRRERGRVPGLLREVGLDPDLAGRRPHELSGGQRQRVVIARALAVRPALLILDEPTGALDLTVRARVLDLLAGLEVARLLITHDLAVVRRLCRTGYVLFAGRIVESGPVPELLGRPAHPYTRALRDAVPVLGGPPPATVPGGSEAVPATTGCPYRLRCPLVAARCATAPGIRDVAGRRVACHRAEEVITGP
jgi:oligopeptide/dipeptide ABC transporter ATP-binding protein